MLPTFEVAHIVRQYGDRFIANKQPLGYHKKVLNAIAICRTAQLGGHVDACDKCSHTRISYNSCRNRHCPKCQSTEREKWIIARKEDLLPVAYYHVVFTIPEQLNQHCLTAPKGNV
ncbi:MAG: transposase zinc-binding domain-containing protein [Bacteroidetes bacterium]|nr:transposase zinc-binding domain-containing protein [Bacteroidota bacterium]